MSRIVLSLFRIAHALNLARVPICPRVLGGVIRILFGCHIGLDARIGRRVQIAYGGMGTVISRKARIGENVYLGTGAVIGCRNGSPAGPTILDNCLIGTGAKVLGPVTVGPNSVVGANAVVIEDVPANAVAVGVPARIVKGGIDIRDYRTRADMAGVEALAAEVTSPVP